MLGMVEHRAFLGVLVMARNECGQFAEWLAHHRREGVDHFYIIDHNSTDRSCMPRLQASADITLWSWWPRIEIVSVADRQITAYNHYLPHVKTEWLAVWDVDEFAFVQNGTLAAALTALPLSVRQFCIPYTTFGSSGLQAQPVCVTSANVMRRATRTDAAIGRGIGKCLQRTTEIASVEVHRSVLANETYHRRIGGCRCSDGRRCTCCGRTGPSPSQACMVPSETILASQRLLRLHHYMTQSAERMKAKSDLGLQRLRSFQRGPAYWKELDRSSNQLMDAALARQSVCAGMRSTVEVERLWGVWP